ncbi:uncharacterized protein DNG_01697 [Cephalotrichum gorgonifer]|uniref:Inosine/uridine-preferring nucleoside hydrolase domain-containing protein n=1 Tax=Cephalotrichum gorgonifer TaxID=2041049 RepID=A0AAE8MRD7_9PEZI|nr:uncharacterized protein DNG_01697 [Cephalotrichum gorgonifer]
MKLHTAMLFALWAVSPSTAIGPPAAKHKKIIIDTDIFSDVDDVGSLAVANVLHSCGIADIAGIAINTNSKYGALAASAINTNFGNSDIPIAAMRPLTNESFFDDWAFTLSEYASKLAYNFPRSLNDSSLTPTPLSMYRSILSSAKDHSVTIISIGFLTNLVELMESPADDSSPLPGKALISAKVKEFVVMGGEYPSGWEYNFGGEDPESTVHAINNWPRDVPITFLGSKLGASVRSGAGIPAGAPKSSPVRAAYEWYVGRCSTVRESWDPLTTLYGILGLDASPRLGIGKVFEYANKIGYNHVSADGSNTWVNDTSVTNQHWLKLTDGVTNTTMARLLDEFYTYSPSHGKCRFRY